MKLFFLLFAFCLSLPTMAQEPEWDWALKQSSGGTGTDQGTVMTLDSSGNVFVSGSFTSQTITFGSVTLSNANYPNVSIYILKYTAEGSVIWAKTIVSAHGGLANYISTDLSGNLYVTGFFTNPSITIGNITLTNTNSPNQDLFLAKFDPNGDVLWAKKAGASNGDFGLCVIADKSGNAYIGGYYKSSSITFGTTTLNNPASPNGNSFLVKYSPEGNVVWAKAASGTNSSNSINYLCIDDADFIIAKGQFQSNSLSWGSSTVNNSSAPGIDVYFTKFNTNGNDLWSKSFGSSDHDYGYTMALDKSGNIFIGGYFKSASLSFGSLSLSNTAAPAFDQYLVKYNSSGSVVWAKKAANSPGNDLINSVVADNEGNVYITGYYQSPSITFGNKTLTNSLGTTQEAFLVKYDIYGVESWAKSIGGSNNDAGNFILADNEKNLFVTGGFASSAITIGSTTLTNTNSGTNDPFFAKLLIKEYCLLSGKLVYDNDPVNSPIACAKIFVSTNSGEKVDSTLTDADGNYTLDSILNGSYIISAKTSTPWGGVNSSDAQIILRQFAGLANLNGLKLRAADINGNQYINASDSYFALLRFTMVKNLFQIPDWIFENSTVELNASVNSIVNLKGICAGDVNASFIPPLCN